ncbi:MAG: ribosome small subunit-dependent GTPase A [Oscillospiraceae bacterium]|nr:ribosome small subunit-dependent GTPase A [Oscillospiraceae bacterium]
MENGKKGLILESLGGLYTVETEDGEMLKLKARGLFRKDGLSPCAGDRCIIRDDVISEICERKNSIIRPPLANLDVMVFVVSTCEPAPNLTLLDKFIAVCEYKSIEPVIAVTKVDLKANKLIPEIYGNIGITTAVCDYENGGGLDIIREKISGRICAFTGNTGAGKSTLLNHIAPELEIKTAEISHKLGRGRHTTRVSRLYKLFDGYAADTPGFSSFETMQYAVILKDKLKYCFREFAEYEGKCRFADCNHIGEKGCEVIEAVKRGEIARSRHESYCQMFEEAKNIKEWEINGR